MAMPAGNGRFTLPGITMTLLAGVFDTSLLGCATTHASGDPGAAVESERTVADLRAKNSAYVRRIEELENRVFILEDQLDSRKLASEQKAPASLPANLSARRSVKPKPAPGSTVPRADSGGRSESAAALDGPPPSLVDDQPVEYAGDALSSPAARRASGADDPSGPRPHLRLGAPEPARELASAPPAAEPLRLYRASLDELRLGRVAPAALGFRKFLQLYPQHDYADNAQYWLGECFYDQKDFVNAEREFRKVIEQYPRGNKVPDAMLKLGFSLHFLGDNKASQVVLESLTRAFPKHEAARLASAQLAHPAEDPLPALIPARLGGR